MRAICLLEEPYVRDMQMFAGRIPEDEKDPASYVANSDEWYDVHRNSLYLGIFEGTDLADIRKHAAGTMNMPGDRITVIEIKERTSTVSQNVHPLAMSYKHWLNRTIWDKNYNRQGVVTFVSMKTDSHKLGHKCLVVQWDDTSISKPFIENITEEPNGHLHITK